MKKYKYFPFLTNSKPKQPRAILPWFLKLFDNPRHLISLLVLIVMAWTLYEIHLQRTLSYLPEIVLSPQQFEIYIKKDSEAQRNNTLPRIWITDIYKERLEENIIEHIDHVKGYFYNGMRLHLKNIGLSPAKDIECEFDFNAIDIFNFINNHFLMNKYRLIENNKEFILAHKEGDDNKVTGFQLPKRNKIFISYISPDPENEHIELNEINLPFEYIAINSLYLNHMVNIEKNNKSIIYEDSHPYNLIPIVIKLRYKSIAGENFEKKYAIVIRIIGPLKTNSDNKIYRICSGELSNITIDTYPTQTIYETSKSNL